MSDDNRVALWWVSHGSYGVTMFSSEEAAADAAQYDDDCAYLGAEFPDGRCLRRDEWPAYEDAFRRSMDRVRERVARERKEPRRSTRTARSIWGEAIVYTDVVPDWVGCAPSSGIEEHRP